MSKIPRRAASNEWQLTEKYNDGGTSSIVTLLTSVLLNAVSLSVCQHGLAFQSVSTPPCAMGRGAGRHNQRNTRSHGAPRRGRRVLIIAVNPENQSNVLRRDYSHAAQQQEQLSTAENHSEAIPKPHKASIAAGFTSQIKNGHPIGRTRCPNPCQRLLAFSRRRRVSVRQHHSGKIGSHARIKNIPYMYNSNKSGNETGDTPGRYRSARCGIPKPRKPLARC